MLDRLFRRARPDRRIAGAFYATLVAQARRPEFYEVCGVPDTVDGRFDLIALHAFLVMYRLKGQGEAAEAFAQNLFDQMFADMDVCLREMGVGDLGVGKRVKAMVRAFYGRIHAYQQGLDVPGDDHRLCVALDNNLYGTVTVAPERIDRMATYLRRAVADLAAQPVERLVAGEGRFGPPPAA